VLSKKKLVCCRYLSYNQTAAAARHVEVHQVVKELASGRRCHKARQKGAVGIGVLKLTKNAKTWQLTVAIRITR